MRLTRGDNGSSAAFAKGSRVHLAKAKMRAWKGPAAAQGARQEGDLISSSVKPSEEGGEV